MTSAEAVLVDTSAFYALVSSSDRYHAAADRTYRQLLLSGRQLWTSSYVLVEFGAVVQNRLGFEVLRTFYDSFDSVFQTLWVDERLHRDAWAAYESKSGNGPSLVDWTLLLGARLLPASIFTFDSDLASEGAQVIP